ncbi:50S ribosomal protein L10 [Patescibacteria group bacterium]|nr:50S ribosomal protein L10 [Patescibacteria group bacterium]
MAKTRIQKEQSVESLSEKLSQAHSVVFADYKGMSMSSLSDLRKTLKQLSAQFLVTKNTLLAIALKKNSLPGEEAVSQGPTATLFAFDDEVLPIKALVKTLKDSQIGFIKAGIVDSQLYDSLAISRLASLPGKQELRAQVVGTINAPIQGMVTVLSANLRNLVFALEQIRQQKGGE